MNPPITAHKATTILSRTTLARLQPPEEINPLVVNITHLNRPLFDDLQQLAATSFHGNRRTSDALRKKISEFLSKEQVREVALSHLKKLVNGLRELNGPERDNYLFNHRAIACLTSRGDLVCGVTCPHELPKLTLHPMNMCHATLSSMGSYREVIGAFVYDLTPHPNDVLRNGERELLTLHRFPLLRQNELTIKASFPHTQQLKKSSVKVIEVPYQFEGAQGLALASVPTPIDPIRKRTLHLLPVKIPRIIDPSKDGECLALLLSNYLRATYRNSTGDGAHRPGRKPHASIVISRIILEDGSHRLLAADGCQTRHPNDPQFCFCAESHGALILFGVKCALLGGIKIPGLPITDPHQVDRITQAITYSTFYSTPPGNGVVEHHAPETCESCVTHLNTCLPDDNGPLQLIGIGNNGVISLRTLQHVSPYSQVERKIGSTARGGKR